MQLPAIIQDLAVIMIVAGVMTLIFRAIGQPVVLGYLLAGFLVGPHFDWIPNIVDLESVKVWAEIGVIFLFFALGLEFSFKKLARVGGAASLTALIEVSGMVLIGFLLGKAFGWSEMDCLFLGGIIAISSTTVIVRAFNDLGLKSRGFVKFVLGILIVEDLVAILLMVILSTLAVSQRFVGAEMFLSAAHLLFFLALWFLLGIFLLPTLLKRVKGLLHEETLLVLSIGLCFFMVALATKVGFSPAFGAFIMGSILAETMESERIEKLIQPVKDLFGAVFFVSVGMLIDPSVLRQFAVPILIITLATICGKILNTVIGALLSGQSLRHSIQAGVSLAQIGEFSFIIASLGLNLKVTSDFLYPLAISVSTITAFTAPFLIKRADPLVAFVERRLSPRLLQALQRFRTDSSTVNQTPIWQQYVKVCGLKFLANSVLVISVFLVVGNQLYPWLRIQFDSASTSQFLSLAVAILSSMPFLWAMTRAKLGGDQAEKLWSEKRYRPSLIAFEATRVFLTLALLGILSSRIVSAAVAIGGVLTFVVLGAYLLSQNLGSFYQKVERRFVKNLHQKEQQAKAKDMPALAPWDAHLAALTVAAESKLVGKSLAESLVRERFGVTIALIQRGRLTIPAPGRNEIIYPKDTLQVIGVDEQIARFKDECEAKEIMAKDISLVDYGLKPFEVTPSAPFVNQTIREGGLREATKGLVVGIEKNGKRTLNPDSSTVIEAGDLLWLVGDLTLLNRIEAAIANDSIARKASL